MPRRKFNDGQEVIYQDLDAISQAAERELYDRIVYQMLQRTSDAFFGDSFKVLYSSPTQLTVTAGLGIQYDSAATSPDPSRKPLYLPSIPTLTLQAADLVNNRIDRICTKYNRTNEITATRKFKDAGTLVVSNQSLVVQTDNLADILVVAGTPAGSPVAPAIPSGYLSIATVLVTAGVGVTGQGDITDGRTLMPIGGSATVDTTGYTRAPVSASTALSAILSSFDTYLKFGYQNYTDFDDMGSDPSSPGASKVRLYIKGGVAYSKTNGGVVSPLGSGGGGGGGANWQPNGVSPVEDNENGEKVWLFATGASQKLTLFLKVPESYIAGRQILMYIGEYSPSSSNTQLLTSTASLVRVNQDAVSSVTNQRVSTNAALTNTVANQYRKATLDLTSGTGTINSLAVSPGDLIRVDLVRGSDTDTADIRFIPSATEVKFS